MNKIELAKNVTSTIVTVSVSKVVSTIIKNNTTVDTVPDKVAVVTSSFVLGSMVADRARDYTDAKVDEAVRWWNENVKKNS